MAELMSDKTGDSPAARAMSEAIELGIDGRSPYPDDATFVDAGAAWAGEEIAKTTEQGRAVVLVSADGRTRVLRAEPAYSAPSPSTRPADDGEGAIRYRR
jgi:hypothetical protein